MEFRTLRYFVYVAEARSFSKASLHLRVAQPALSRQVRKLEHEIGTPLFLRAGRHLELTEAGRILLSRAHALLRQVSNTLEDVRTSASNLSGTVTIGVSPATCEVVAPLLMKDCKALHPRLRLDFVEGFSRSILGQLLNQEITLCLFHNPPPHKTLLVYPLLIEAMYLVGPPADAAGLPPVTERTTLDGLPLILPNDTHALRQLVDRALGDQAGKLDIAVQTDGMVTTRALVTAGHGYTILPYSAIHQQLLAGQLSAAQIPDMDIPWTLSLACRNDQADARAVRAIRDILRTHFDGLPAGNLWGTSWSALHGSPDRRAERGAP